MNTKNLFQIILAVAIFSTFSTQVVARSWRIHNNIKYKPDFTTINDACSSEEVQDGDTLYLDQGCNLTAAQYVTKQLTIIGCGYEGTTQPYAYAMISGTFVPRAANVKIMSTILSGEVNIQANNVIVERCRSMGGIRTSGNNCQNAVIRQCYITRDSGVAIGGQGKTSTYTMNWTIENCIINTWGSYSQAIVNLYSAIIRNNLLISISGEFYYYTTIANTGSSQIINNVIINTNYANYAIYNTDVDQLTYNVISQNIRSEYNRVNVTKLDDIYTGDIQSYTLVENSPAQGYGTDGLDCGIFGGIYPYVKGGRPFGHPYYTNFKVASKPDENDKLKVTLNIKMQDE